MGQNASRPLRFHLLLGVGFDYRLLNHITSSWSQHTDLTSEIFYSEVGGAPLPNLPKEEMKLQMHLALAEHSSFQRALGGQTSSQLE